MYGANTRRKKVQEKRKKKRDFGNEKQKCVINESNNFKNQSNKELFTK